MTSLTSAIGRAYTISTLPDPFQKIAQRSFEINLKVGEAYGRLIARVGEEKTKKLIAQFSNEAFAGTEVNHEYIIRMMNEHGE